MSFIEVYVLPIIFVIFPLYFSIFSGSVFTLLCLESYNLPRITCFSAGIGVFFIFKLNFIVNLCPAINNQ